MVARGIQVLAAARIHLTYLTILEGVRLMKKITIEMPVVKKCSADECAYNVGSNCQARAITIGDSIHPACDTFVDGVPQAKQSNHSAGIGACKTAGCKFNDGLECMADSIQVGMVRSEANCMTYALR
jgi:hypothetical protein